MSLLILGGTADGRHLAAALHNSGCPVIYSVAGLVRHPKLDCEVISGGFSQFGGLTAYLKAKSVRAILDVTHPYAQTMSSAAHESAQACGIPCWRFHRLPWQPEADDQWQCYDDWSALLADLNEKRSVFLTAGQVPPKALKALEILGKHGQQQILRTAVEAKEALPASIKWHKAIGPFSLAHEMDIMRQYRIDALVTKNSGGTSMQAKLFAARELGIPVLMFTRPKLPAVDKEFNERLTCQAFVENWYQLKNP